MKNGEQQIRMEFQSTRNDHAANDPKCKSNTGLRISFDSMDSNQRKQKKILLYYKKNNNNKKMKENLIK